VSDTESPPARGLRERLLRPTLPELWTFLAIALPVLASLIATLPTVDLAYQLRAGADILAGRGIPAVDTWTFTAAGRPWLDQQWGAQAVLAAIYGVAGWSGLAILRAALVGLAFGLILVAIRHRQPGLSGRVTAWLTLAAFVVAAPALALRPQLLAMACFALILALLAGRRRRPRAIWLVPVVAIAWANLHGSFILAPVLVGLVWLEDIGERSPRAGPTFGAALLTGAATLVTPFGLEAWRYAVGLASNREVTSRITEWQPTTPTDVPGILFWASVLLVAGAVLAIVRAGRTVTWPSVIALVAFAALGAVAARGIAWWPGVAAVTLAGLLQRPVALGEAATAPRRTERGQSINAHVALGLLLACVAVLPVWRPIHGATGAPTDLLGQAPASVTLFLRAAATPEDRVWNPQVWGSWFEFAVPAPKYAFDSRIEVIPPDAWRDGDTVAAAGPGWEAILDARGVTMVVAEGDRTAPLAAALAGSPAWYLLADGGDGSIWVRHGR